MTKMSKIDWCELSKIKQPLWNPAKLALGMCEDEFDHHGKLTGFVVPTCDIDCPERLTDAAAMAVHVARSAIWYMMAKK